MFSAVTSSQAQDLIGFDRSSFGQVVLSNKQSGGIELELAVGSYNNESIRNYSANSIFSKLGRSVGRLDILTDVQNFPCTAFIVSEKHILTNYHCVPGIIENIDIGATRIEGVTFMAGYTQQGVEEGARIYRVNPIPIEAHEDLDYALLEVLGNPSADFGMLTLSDVAPQDGDPYWVIGHPMGEAQRISREKCRANSPALSADRLLHTCDTLPGNSGSPVIDAGLQTVIGLHHAGSRRDSVNFAIPMGLILKRSKVLVAALKAPVANGSDANPAETADTGNRAICDALFAEARSSADCLVYETYVEVCSDHPLVAIAAKFRIANCSTKPTAVAAPTKTETGPAPAPAPSDAEREFGEVTAALDAEQERSVDLAGQLDAAIKALNVAKIVGNARKTIDAQNKVARLSDALNTSLALSTKLRLRRSELFNRVPQKAAVVNIGPNWATGAIDITMQMNSPDQGHSDYFAHAVNATGNRLAVGTEYGEVHVWNLVTGNIAQTLKAGSYRSLSVAFDPTGRYLAAGRDDKTIALFDAATGHLVRLIEGHDHQINGLAFSPDRERLVSASGDATARLWDVATGRQILVLKGHKRSVLAVRFSADGKRIYTASSDKTAIAWDAEDGSLLRRFEGHDHWIVALDISPDGSQLLTGSADKTMALWDTATGKRLWSVEFSDWVKTVAFSPDGRFAAAAAGPLRVFDLAEKRVVARLGETGSSLSFTPDGRSLTVMNNRRVAVYNLDD